MNHVTAGFLVSHYTTELLNSSIPTARLDTIVLLEDATAKDRSWLLAHPEYALSEETVKKVGDQIERRAKHEPLAYIRGKSEFYGREFMVTPDTLEPRPETETMIDLLKNLLKHKTPLQEVRPPKAKCVIVDMGTGSGCLGITAKLEFPQLQVLSTDISDECLKIARLNAKKLGAKIAFYRGNLLEPVLATYHLPITAIMANLPYVPDNHALNQAAMHEPKLAIFGGPDGLDLYRKLFQQINTLLNKPKYLLTESLPSQHKELARIANVAGYKVVDADNFIQVFSYK